MKAAIIDGYEHRVASHCESGSVRNLLAHAGVEASEPLIFGTGSGPAFYYLFFAKGPATFPLLGIRNRPGAILGNVARLCGLGFSAREHPTTDEALARADELIDRGVPVVASVDMFYMKYLPAFMRVHAPFHFIVLVGRGEGGYVVSDPYNEELGVLGVDDLRAAWATHARLGRDNFMAHVETVPDRIDWPRVVVRAMRRTCRDMLLGPLVRRLMFFAGIEGMRTYARKIRTWPDRYAGVDLREGILFNAVTFEAQGTGGGAFRLIYGAFLQQAAELLDDAAFESFAEEMIENGRAWREISRRFVAVGKKLPMEDERYARWRAENGGWLAEELGRISDLVDDRADFEEDFFGRLRRALPPS
jgi:hypothetical protein